MLRLNLRTVSRCIPILALALAIACQQPLEVDDVELDLDLRRCPKILSDYDIDAPDPKNPTDCRGPLDGGGWTLDLPTDRRGRERYRDENFPNGLPECKPPPAGGCKQVVLGRIGDLGPYYGCPGYITLYVGDRWTIGVNDQFLACAANNKHDDNMCRPAIIVPTVNGDDDDELPNPKPGDTYPKVSVREICQLNRFYNCRIRWGNATRPSSIDCPQPKRGRRARGGRATAETGSECEPCSATPEPQTEGLSSVAAGETCDECCFNPCGDGVLDSGEECDDGNSDPDDGCDRCFLPAPTVDECDAETLERCEMGDPDPLCAVCVQ